ncbi:MAG: hypothetical protein GVY34_06180 [Alphaproteobacteria bacterium]|jgi:hypothetical protein|nr:hypothetical protein [Alphaproteobacteria bacterium]
MQDQQDFAADMADMTRMEHEARQMRAAFMADSIAAAFRAVAQILTPRRVAS